MYLNLVKPTCILLFLAYFSLLSQIQLVATLALNLPRQDSGIHDSTITNSVETEVETARNAGGVHTSRRRQQPNPTSPPANCSSNSSSTKEGGAAAASFNQSAFLNSIQQYMLARLNLTEVPARVAQVDIPPAQLATYHARLQAQNLTEKEPVECPEQKTTQYARTVDLYFPEDHNSMDKGKIYDKHDKSKATGVKGLSPPVLYNLTFNNLELASSSRLWSVNLRLFKLKSHTSARGTNPTESVKIFLVEKDGEVAKFEVLLASKILRSEDDEYVSFDIAEEIRKWRNASSQHQTLQLSVFVDTPRRIDTGMKLPPAIVFDVPTYWKSDGQPQRPQLVIETLRSEERSTQQLNHSLRRRRKRSTFAGAVNSDFCFNHPNESNCCIRNLTVNIQQDLGLNHILLPRTFQPNYCSGSCHNSLWSSANLATQNIQNIRRNNPTAAAEPCCVPHTMKPLSVLMYLNTRIVVKEIPNMIVTSCICR